jgi:hypothetical protein
MWHFAAGSCYPQSANDGGSPHSPVGNPDCWADLGQGCANPIPWKGVFNQKGPNNPTYWYVSHCDRDDTWRIYYGESSLPRQVSLQALVFVFG